MLIIYRDVPMMAKSNSFLTTIILVACIYGLLTNVTNAAPVGDLDTGVGVVDDSFNSEDEGNIDMELDGVQLRPRRLGGDSDAIESADAVTLLAMIDTEPSAKVIGHKEQETLDTLRRQIRFLKQRVASLPMFRRAEEIKHDSKRKKPDNRIRKHRNKMVNYNSKFHTVNAVNRKHSDNEAISMLSRLRRKRNIGATDTRDIVRYTSGRPELEQAVERHLERFLVDMFLLFQYDMNTIANPSPNVVTLETSHSAPKHHRKPRSRPKRDTRSLLQRSRPKRDIRTLLQNPHARKVLRKYFAQRGRSGDEHAKALLRYG